MFYIDNDLKTSDKYDMAKFIELKSDGVFNSLNSYFLYKLPLLHAVGYYTIRKEENRPDLLSYNIYGETQYWWILMWYNHFLKPQDLKNGVLIKYPSKSAIQQMYMEASLAQKVE